jgi:putative lipase involved disintegration of autophagic bodies
MGKLAIHAVRLRSLRVFDPHAHDQGRIRRGACAGAAGLLLHAAIPDRFWGAYLLVQPSFSDACSLLVLEAMARAAYQRARDQFAWDRVVDDLEATYTRLLSA